MIDVCLLLEGSYPYVSGGVSTWVHQMISEMKNIKFAIVNIAPYPDPTRTAKYKIPPQVIYLKDVNLHDYDLVKRAVRKPSRKDFNTIKNVYESLEQGDVQCFSNLINLFQGSDRCFDIPTFFSSPKIFDFVNEFYKRLAWNISYLDFFWSWRSTHLPLFQILQTDLPPAKVYHAISTGYAGLLGVVAKTLWNGKFLLTEHGIYTYERMLEITQAVWIYEPETPQFKATGDLSFFKRWWSTVFNIMSKAAYEHADSIYTLFEGNKLKQIAYGADKEKIKIIPNGINIHGLGTIKRQRRSKPHVGLIGRVVSIKDIKAYLHAARIVLNEMPEARFYVIGPTDEDPDYFEECKMLAELLDIESSLTFTGYVDVRDYYSFLDVIVLTSLSEAQPYAVHEANLAGIPVVATDVGACREMIEGRGAEDQSIGKGGIVTDVANPEQTAKGIIRLLKNDTLYEQCSTSGIKRVKKYYNQDDMISQYLNIYESHL